MIVDVCLHLFGEVEQIFLKPQLPRIHYQFTIQKNKQLTTDIHVFPKTQHKKSVVSKLSTKLVVHSRKKRKFPADETTVLPESTLATSKDESTKEEELATAVTWQMLRWRCFDHVYFFRCLFPGFLAPEGFVSVTFLSFCSQIWRNTVTFGGGFCVQVSQIQVMKDEKIELIDVILGFV